VGLVAASADERLLSAIAALGDAVSHSRRHDSSQPRHHGTPGSASQKLDILSLEVPQKSPSFGEQLPVLVTVRFVPEYCV